MSDDTDGFRMLGGHTTLDDETGELFGAALIQAPDGSVFRVTKVAPGAGYQFDTASFPDVELSTPAPRSSFAEVPHTALIGGEWSGLRSKWEEWRASLGEEQR